MTFYFVLSGACQIIIKAVYSLKDTISVSTTDGGMLCTLIIMFHLQRSSYMVRIKSFDAPTCLSVPVLIAFLTACFHLLKTAAISNSVLTHQKWIHNLFITFRSFEIHTSKSSFIIYLWLFRFNEFNRFSRMRIEFQKMTWCRGTQPADGTLVPGPWMLGTWESRSLEH